MTLFSRLSALPLESVSLFSDSMMADRISVKSPILVSYSNSASSRSSLLLTDVPVKNLIYSHTATLIRLMWRQPLITISPLLMIIILPPTLTVQ